MSTPFWEAVSEFARMRDKIPRERRDLSMSDSSQVSEDTVECVELDEGVEEHVRAFAKASGCTPREADVLVELVRGPTRTTGAIAKRLKVKGNTANNHLKGIFDRTGARSKESLLAMLYADAMRANARWKYAAQTRGV